MKEIATQNRWGSVVSTCCCQPSEVLNSIVGWGRERPWELRKTERYHHGQGTFQNQVCQLLPHSDIQGRSFNLRLKREVSIPSNWVPRWIWREHILCLVLSLLDLSNWEMYLFLFRAFFLALLKYTSCNWRLIWLPYLCLWTKYIPFIAVFQYKYKGFYILYNQSEILESAFVVQNKMTGQENWEFLANDKGQWVKLFI